MALSRLKRGFDSRRERHSKQGVARLEQHSKPLVVGPTALPLERAAVPLLTQNDRVDRAAIQDLLVIADALETAPDAFLVRRTLERIERREIDAAEAAAVLRAWSERLGEREGSALEGDDSARALAVARLFAR